MLVSQSQLDWLLYSSEVWFPRHCCCMTYCLIAVQCISCFYLVLQLAHACPFFSWCFHFVQCLLFQWPASIFSVFWLLLQEFPAAICRYGSSFPGRRDPQLSLPLTLAEIFWHPCLQSNLQTYLPVPQKSYPMFQTPMKTPCRFPLAPMGVLAPGSAHARASVRPPIDTSWYFPAPASAE